MNADKTPDIITEVKDAALDEISGGTSYRSGQQGPTLCIKCRNPLPVGHTCKYCNTCLNELSKQGVHPFI